jgi:group II intron reverse transcriptase/maturase
MGIVSTVEMQIAERSRKYPGAALTNLHSYITPAYLQSCYEELNKNSSRGVDGMSWAEYKVNVKGDIEKLHSMFKNGSYRAPDIRRAYISKGDGTKRPLGIPTVEDKILQRAVSKILTPVYEQEFYDFSFGFRPGKSAHGALQQLFEEVSFRGKRYIIDADMKNYFGSIDHGCLRDIVDQRIKDGVIRKQIDKWLKAGILESGMVSYPKEGTPQGGSISPILSNIYLHEVLDKWFIEQIQPLLKGGSSLIRFADDFLLCFTNKEDAERVLRVLPKRLSKYGLTLHPDKTRLIDLSDQDKDKRGFDFLGFTHYMSKSRKGKDILKRKTSSKKLRISLNKICDWIKVNRHLPIKALIFELNRKLRGYYEYYGITFNSRSLEKFYVQVERMLYKWINRKGGKRLTWEWYSNVIRKWRPLARPKIYHSYQLAKP